MECQRAFAVVYAGISSGRCAVGSKYIAQQHNIVLLFFPLPLPLLPGAADRLDLNYLFPKILATKQSDESLGSVFKPFNDGLGVF